MVRFQIIKSTAVPAALLLGLILLVSALPAEESGPEFLKHFSWREIGPANPGGRITDIEGVESDPRIIYVGAATGGVWKTVNAGTTWTPIFDDQPTASIGDIAVSRSSPDILFVGLKDTHHIGRVLIHPDNPDIVYVAALGHLWGTNTERGLYKTTDGGKTWNNVLPLDERTGVTDVTMDSGNPDILYAAAHERLHDQWDAGDPVDQWGPKAGIYITKNGGETWIKAVKGLPKVEVGRIGIDASRSQPGTVYAIVSTEKTKGNEREGTIKAENPNPDEGGIYKSVDFGESWTQTNTYNNRPSYYSQIRVDPNNADAIWTCGSPLGFSDDGGKTLVIGPPVQSNTHIDYHALWIDPANSEHVLLGGDGGFSVTWDRGDNWDIINTFGLAQYYAITADMRKPYYVYGGLQDNGNWGGPSRSRRNSGIVNEDWYPLSNADGFFNQVDPTDFNLIYYEMQNGGLVRTNLATGDSQYIRPRPALPKPGERPERYRFDWNSPLLLSPHNPHTLYFGGNKLFKSVDRGDNWRAISPDLTADPKGTYTAIVSLDGHRLDDMAPYLYVTDDYGKTWKKITNGLPEGSVYVVREDYKNPDLLFAGSEFAVYISLDRGENWFRFMNGLPTVPVHDLLIHPRDMDLIAGTHGRGAWIVDNLTALQEWTPEVREADVHLFAVRPETQWASTYEWTWVTDRRFFKPNPPDGSTISYYLKNNVEEDLEIEILDIHGDVVRNLKVENMAGLHHILWNFRKNPPQAPSKASQQSRARFRRMPPMVGPGQYLVRLKTGDKVLTTTLTLEKDNPGYLGR
ncbi:MAG: hypothetical protein KKB53_03015 [Acidobacteria bacterium]|nr:hypothetical protein [Acidobacteriota bacterium]